MLQCLGFGIYALGTYIVRPRVWYAPTRVALGWAIRTPGGDVHHVATLSQAEEWIRRQLWVEAGPDDDVVIIVPRTSPRLYATLRAEHAGRPNIRIVRDRQEFERRGTARPDGGLPGLDHRWTERRHAGLDEMLRQQGYAILTVPRR